MTGTFEAQRSDAPPAAAGRHRNVVALAMVAGLPALAYYLWICLTFYGGSLVIQGSQDEAARLLGHVPGPDTTALLLYLTWLLLQILLHVAAPARTCEGLPLADGTRLTYRLNGWSAFWITPIVLLIAVWAGALSPTIAYDHFGPLLTTANIVAFVFAGVLVYFLILLVHRERREHAMCLQKYGPDWEAYCREVRWRIVPGPY
jgi:hypothetical protein